jgi:hypothetical protein
MTVGRNWHAGGHHEGQLRLSSRTFWSPPLAARDGILANVGLWPKADIGADNGNVRF